MLCLDVVKRFYHYTHRTTTLREFFIRSVLRRPIHEGRAQFSLRGFDLHVRDGESVALIGANGSGKSTALRLIAGIYAPSEGYIETRGRLAAVIELGVGFNPELTGAENVKLYGAVMGLSRREIEERFPGIVAFAEVGDFIREPVKYYSSGMQARLAFAVAVCVDPDILLVDEVLAVGDLRFRERCVERLRAFQARGGTMVVVSHDMAMVRSLCSRALWLERGRVRMEGEVNRVVDAYQAAAT
ncbi:MAG: ABC transporter ATP-binding protein [Gemmatimonadaceae bacterium]